jgi:HEAT repeat protein
MNRLASLFNVEAGEGRLVSLLFVYSFLLGAASNFVQTAAFALFMIEFDAQALALVYVTNGLVIPGITFLYLRLGRRLSFASLLAANLGFLLVLFLVFRFGLGVGGAKAVIFGLPVLFQIVVNFGPLAFWTLVNRVFNVRQGKRLFGLTWAGYWLAIVITGLLIPVLVRWMGTANLLLFAAGAMAGALLILRFVTHNFAGELVASPAAGPTAEKEPATSPFRNRYVLLIFALVVLWWFAFFFVDNAFLGAAAAQYPSTEQLASFLGLYLAVVGVGAMIGNAFLAGPVIARYGVRVSLLILPVALLIGTGSVAVIGFAAGVVLVFFWLLVLNKVLDVTLGFSIDRSALSILYQPLPADLRRQAQTVAEGAIQPVASGLAGLALFALGTLFASSLLPIVYALVPIVVAWLVVAALAGRQYPAMLMAALNKRSLERVDLTLTDGVSLDVLRQGLLSPHPGVVVYSLDMLEAIEHESLPTFLLDALRHPSPDVRKTALQSMERLGVASAMPRINQLVIRETDPAVRGQAVRAMAALGGSGACQAACAYLDDPNPPVREGAMVGLLRSGGIEGVLTAGNQLLRMAESHQPAERAAAARVLGEVGVGSFYQPVVKLLADEDVEVRRAALRAAGQLKSPRLWPHVIDKLCRPGDCRAAAAALVAGGEAVLPELAGAFSQEGQTTEAQAQFARIGGRIGGEQAMAWLKGHLAHPDPGVRTTVLSGLRRCGYHAMGEERAEVREQIQAEAALEAEMLALQVGAGHDDAVVLLRDALEEAVAHGQARIFSLLSFLYDPHAVVQARDNLALASGEKRAYALEVLDVLLPANLKKTVLPLLADSDPGQKLDRLTATYPQPLKNRGQCLGEIIEAPQGRFSAWMRACALYAAGRLPEPSLRDGVAAARTAPDPVVRETATWALAQLDASEGESREETMLTTIEKVIALKQARIFSETPDETLAAIAALLEEVPLREGETIFEKGDLGNTMFLIVDGKVRIHDEGGTLNHLGSGEVFGEMAVLDAEPRMASVTAVEDSRLLRLAQEPLYEVMEDRSEVGRGVIRVLSQHLREVTRDLSELRARQEGVERSH